MNVHSACTASDIDAAAACLCRGGVLIFPTETFYALGCLALNTQAVARVYQLKQRSVQQPLPLLAADTVQAGEVARLDAAPEKLLTHFWPGPLTVLLPACARLPELLLNDADKAAVRVTSHPLAAELARRAGGVLTASSANVSGHEPVCRLEALDARLLDALHALGNMGGILNGGPLPSGGEPSSIVEPLERNGQPLLHMIRAGAVSAAMLTAAGFNCR